MSGLPSSPARRPVRPTVGKGSPGRKGARSRSPSAGSDLESKSALTRGAWVEAATQVLVDQGIDHVRVDVLAQELGVTRGSFYWHFQNREDLLREVLQQWRRLATIELSRRLVEGGLSDPRAQLRDMISLPHRGRAASRAARIELAIRAWARRDALAREALDEADSSRLQVHTDTFLRLGFAAEEARLRAWVTYSTEVAESMLHHLGTDDERRARQAFTEQLLCSPLGPASPSSTSTDAAPN